MVFAVAIAIADDAIGIVRNDAAIAKVNGNVTNITRYPVVEASRLFFGFAIWYVLHAPKPAFYLYLLLVLVLVLTVFSPTDLFPEVFQAIVVKFALKALPCFLAWLFISYNLLFNSFDNNSLPHEKA